MKGALYSHKAKFRTVVSLLLLSLALLGCGGGGGSSTIIPETNEIEPNETTTNAQAISSGERIRGKVQSLASALTNETEPNDSQISTGASLTLNGENIVIGTISNSDNNDFFRLIPAANGTVTLRLNVLDNTSNLELRLRTAGGSQLAMNSGIGATALSFAVTAGVTYVVQVTANVTSGTDSYELLATMGTASTESVASNNTTATASGPLFGNELISGAADRTTDTTDFYRLTPASAGLVRAQLRIEDHGNYNLSLTLFAADGTTALAISDSSADEQLDFAVSAGGTYFLRVFINNSSSNGAALYDLVLSSPTVVDRVDAFKFTAAQTGNYVFSLDPDSSILSSGSNLPVDRDLFIYSQNLTQRYSNVLTGDNDEKVVISATANDMFFVVVNAFNSSRDVNYSLSVNSTTEATNATAQSPAPPVTTWSLDSSR